MSTLAMTWALRGHNGGCQPIKIPTGLDIGNIGPCACRLVLQVIADHATGSPPFLSWPGLAAIGEETDQYRRDVQKAIDVLIANGLMRIERPGGGRGRPTRYELLIPDSFVVHTRPETSGKAPRETSGNTSGNSSGNSSGNPPPSTRDDELQPEPEPEPLRESGGERDSTGPEPGLPAAAAAADLAQRERVIAAEIERRLAEATKAGVLRNPGGFAHRIRGDLEARWKQMPTELRDEPDPVLARWLNGPATDDLLAVGQVVRDVARVLGAVHCCACGLDVGTCPMAEPWEGCVFGESPEECE